MHYLRIIRDILRREYMIGWKYLLFCQYRRHQLHCAQESESELAISLFCSPEDTMHAAATSTSNSEYITYMTPTCPDNCTIFHENIIAARKMIITEHVSKKSQWISYTDEYTHIKERCKEQITQSDIHCALIQYINMYFSMTESELDKTVIDRLKYV